MCERINTIFSEMRLEMADSTFYFSIYGKERGQTLSRNASVSKLFRLKKDILNACSKSIQHVKVLGCVLFSLLGPLTYKVTLLIPVNFHFLKM